MGFGDFFNKFQGPKRKGVRFYDEDSYDDSSSSEGSLSSSSSSQRRRRRKKSKQKMYHKNSLKPKNRRPSIHLSSEDESDWASSPLSEGGANRNVRRYSSKKSSSALKKGKRNPTSYESPKVSIKKRGTYTRELLGSLAADYTTEPKGSSDAFQALTREELFELPARDLRKKCNRLGLNTQDVSEKEDLVDMLHSFFRHSKEEKSPIKYPGSGQQGGLDLFQRQQQVMAMNDENEQMVEILQEIIPFCGQGDAHADSTVKETVDRISAHYLDSRDSGGNTLMMLSCQSTLAVDLIPLFLSKGADPNAQNSDGASCLHFVSYADSFSPEAAKILVEKGARAEVIEERFGCTPLHYAASIGDTRMCQLLCNAGAIPTTKDKAGCDAITYARQSKKMDCVEYLLSIIKGKSNNFDLEWEELTDQRTGYKYFHNWETGESVWSDEFNLRHRMKAKLKSNQESKIDDQSSISRPPPPLSGVKSTKSMGKLLEQEKEHLALDDEAKPISDKRGRASERKISNNTMIEASEAKHRFSEIGVKRGFSEDSSGDSVSECGKVRKIEDSNLKDIISDSCTDSGTSSDDGIGWMNSKKKQVPKCNKEELPEGIEIPSEPLNLSPTSQSPVTTKLVTKQSFDHRLANMEKQFIDQLKQMEGIKSKQAQPSSKSRSFNVKEMANKISELQAAIGERDLEIAKLKRDIMNAESTQKAAASKSLVDHKEVSVGCSDDWTSSEKMKAAEKELFEREQEKLKLQEQFNEAQAQYKKLTRELEAMQQNKERNLDSLQLAEDQLKVEKNAKDEAIYLLEKTRKGVEVDSELSESLKQEKKRAEDLISRLSESVKRNGEEAAEEIKKLTTELDDSQRKQLDTISQVKMLTNEIEKQGKRQEEEKRSSENARRIEIESVKNDLSTAHINEMENLNKQLQEEKLLKMEKEVQRNAAVSSYEDALKRTNDAEAKLEQISSMIKEAQALVSANEKLHRSLALETDKRKALHNKLEDLKGRIRVYVRIRPLSNDERSHRRKEVLVKEDKRTCVMQKSDEDHKEAKSWEFDNVFQGSNKEGNTQEEVFSDTRLLVTSAVDGFNVCIFAYGQTGSGKTYTMFGPGGDIPDIRDFRNLDESLGLAPRVAVELFKILEEKKSSFEVSVHVSMFELYNANVRDLMRTNDESKKQSLKIKLAEHSGSGMVEVNGGIVEEVQDARELLAVFKKGAGNRTTASTLMNADSSRSHLITTMVCTLVNKRTGRATKGKLTLVDLAGSERISKSGAAGAQLKEAQNINKSLSALGDVINALTSKSKHIPYRNHPLTMLMSDSMGGNAKTLMFVCCSPADYNRGETVNSLDFAKRCKDVKNNINGSGGDAAQVKALRAELARMKKEKGQGYTRKSLAPRRPGM